MDYAWQKNLGIWYNGVQLQRYEYFIQQPTETIKNMYYWLSVRFFIISREADV